MPSHVPLYYPAPTVFGALLPDPVNLVTPMEVGRLGVAVYDGSTRLGMVTPILSADTDEAINEVGIFSFSVPAARGGLLQIGYEVELVREGEGIVMPRGRIEHVRDVYEGDKHVLQVQCSTLAAELVNLTTYRGMIFRHVSAATALAGIIADTGWTAQLTGSGYLDITRRWDDSSRFAALNDYAAMQKAYIRETLTPREIEVKNTFTPAGFRLGELEALPRHMPEHMGLVKSVKVTREGAIWNRIMPSSKADGDVILDLEQANRTAPYEIISRHVHPPSISDVVQLVDSATTGVGDHYAVSASAQLYCSGEARVAVAIFAMQSTSTTGLPRRVTLGGKRMTGPAVLPGTSHFVMRWVLINPSVGLNKISVEYDVDGPPANGVWTFVSVENTRNFVLFSGEAATGTTVISDDTLLGSRQLLVSLVAHATATATANGGQTVINPSAAVVAAGLERLARLSYKQTGPTPDTVGWTLGSSVAFVHIVIEFANKESYYIQDQDSIDQYGVREKPLPLGEYRPVDGSNIIASANALYDKAVDYLMEHKQPAVFYDLAVSYLPAGPREWLVGDSIPFRDETFICTRRSARYDQSGHREWKLTLATVARHQKSTEETFANVISRLEAVQSAQV